MLFKGHKEEGKPAQANDSPAAVSQSVAEAAQALAGPARAVDTVVRPHLDSLRSRSRAPRNLISKQLPDLQSTDDLLPIEPSLERSPLRPASFPHIKALSRSPLRVPRTRLEPAKLVDAACLPPLPSPARAARAVAAAEAAVRRSRENLPAPVPTPSPAQPAQQVNLSKTANEPLWHALFSPEAQEARRSSVVEPAAAPVQARSERSLSASRHDLRESGLDWGSAGDISVDGLTSSRESVVIEEPPKRIWFWQAIEGVFLSKAFSRGLAAVMAVMFASTLNVEWSEWVGNRMATVRQPIANAMAQLSQPVRERAAFFIVDDFSRGVDHWKNNVSLAVDPAGWIKVGQGLALHGDTDRLRDYRLDFDAKIQSEAVGWVVRAPDTNNYYGFKLKTSGTASSPGYALQRYSMIDGVRSAIAKPIELASDLPKVGDFNRISVRVVGDKITTLVNGWGVDYWQDERLPQGGVGLLADAGESALVRKMTVSGNDDTWGLILYGAMESMESLKTFVGGSEAAPAMILFYRPDYASPQRPLLSAAR